MIRHGSIKVTLLLTIVASCLFEFLLHRQSELISEYATVFLSLQWMLLVCLAVWCGTFLFLTFRLNDLPLMSLLLIAVVVYFIGYPAFARKMDAIIFLAGVTLGKGTRFLFKSGNLTNEESRITNEKGQKAEVESLLVRLITLLAFSSWWHLEMAGPYHGPRWMGLWNNPNIYGM